MAQPCSASASATSRPLAPAVRRGIDMRLRYCGRMRASRRGARVSALDAATSASILQSQPAWVMVEGRRRMRFLSALRRNPRDADRTRAAASPSVAADLREEVLEHGLDAARALALADALEAEGRLIDALEALVQANRLQPDDPVERRLVRLRTAAFGQLDRSLAAKAWPPIVPEDPARGPEGPPVVTPAELSPGLLLNGILRHGSVWVRGLVPRARVARLRNAIDRSFEAYDASDAGTASAEMARWYSPLEGIQNPAIARAWRRQGNGVLTADSPRAFFEFMETVHELGLDRLIAAYLGERPALSAEKCTLFRVDARDWRVRLANWHQDGAFLGRGNPDRERVVRAVALRSRCAGDGSDPDPPRARAPRRRRRQPLWLDGLARDGRARAAGRADLAARVRGGRRAPLRPPHAASHRGRRGDAERPQYDRELVLRPLGLSQRAVDSARRVRAGSRRRAVRDPARDTRGERT